MISKTRSCIVVADGSRARILAHRWPVADEDASGRDPLHQLHDLVSPGHRQRSGDTYAEPRPGFRRGGHHEVHQGTGDHRNRYRERQIQGFAQHIAEVTGAVCQQMGSCRLIVLAAPDLLVDLRETLAKHSDWTRGVTEYVEGYRSLTRLNVPELHDWLASAELLPARYRSQRVRY